MAEPAINTVERKKRGRGAQYTIKEFGLPKDFKEKLDKCLWVQPAFIFAFPPVERERAAAHIKASIVRAICLQVDLIVQDPTIVALVQECRQAFPEPDVAVSSILAGAAGEGSGSPALYYESTNLGTILSDPVVREQARVERPMIWFITSMPPRKVIMKEWGKLLPGAFYLLKIYEKVGTGFQVSDVQGPAGSLRFTLLPKLLPKIDQPISRYGLVASIDRRSLLLPAQEEILKSLWREGMLDTSMVSLAGDRGFYADRPVLTTPLYDAQKPRPHGPVLFPEDVDRVEWAATHHEYFQTGRLKTFTEYGLSLAKVARQLLKTRKVSGWEDMSEAEPVFQDAIHDVAAWLRDAGANVNDWTFDQKNPTSKYNILSHLERVLYGSETFTFVVRVGDFLTRCAFHGLYKEDGAGVKDAPPAVIHERLVRLFTFLERNRGVVETEPPSVAWNLVRRCPEFPWLTHKPVPIKVGRSLNPQIYSSYRYLLEGAGGQETLVKQYLAEGDLSPQYPADAERYGALAVYQFYLEWSHFFNAFVGSQVRFQRKSLTAYIKKVAKNLPALAIEATAITKALSDSESPVHSVLKINILGDPEVKALAGEIRDPDTPDPHKEKSMESLNDRVAVLMGLNGAGSARGENANVLKVLVAIALEDWGALATSVMEHLEEVAQDKVKKEIEAQQAKEE